MKKKINISKTLLGSALALGVTANLAASAITVADLDNVLAISELSSSSTVLSNDGDHKCGEGKCGEGKCGEGKCGEGKDKKKKK